MASVYVWRSIRDKRSTSSSCRSPLASSFVAAHESRSSTKVRTERLPMPTTIESMSFFIRFFFFDANLIFSCWFYFLFFCVCVGCFFYFLLHSLHYSSWDPVSMRLSSIKFHRWPISNGGWFNCLSPVPSKSGAILPKRNLSYWNWWPKWGNFYSSSWLATGQVYWNDNDSG